MFGVWVGDGPQNSQKGICSIYLLDIRVKYQAWAANTDSFLFLGSELYAHNRVLNRVCRVL